MGLNIGLYLRRSEGPIRKSEVLVRKSDVLVRISDQDGTKVEDSPIALVSLKSCYLLASSLATRNCGSLSRLHLLRSHVVTASAPYFVRRALL